MQCACLPCPCRLRLLELALSELEGAHAGGLRSVPPLRVPAWLPQPLALPLLHYLAAPSPGGFPACVGTDPELERRRMAQQYELYLQTRTALDNCYLCR